MRSFELTVSFPTGTILVGGHAALPARASAAHARDHQGRPFIPATALRGALRETLEALLRGAGHRVCDSGTGVDPEEAALLDEPASSAGCTLDEGDRCICCRLFGSRAKSLAPNARVFSSLILGDASLEGAEKVTWTNRQHVSVSRTHRSAESERLFLRRTPALHERTMRAEGHTVEPELDPYLEAAVRATKHIGSGRSTGLSRVELALTWGAEIAGVTQTQTDSQEDLETQDFVIRVTLKSPTMLGGPVLGTNYRPTRDEIPGSVLRGALGFAIARTLDDPDGDTDFQALVAEHGGADFGFLYPVRGAREDACLSAPWPLTARTCKAHPHTHGVVDTLFDRLAAASIERVDQVEGVHTTALRSCHCSAPLRSVSGFRGAPRAPSKRVVTRASIERRSSSVRGGALFSYELLEPGAVFEGTIRNVPAGTRGLLTRALTLPIHVGRGASSGWGRVAVEQVCGDRGVRTPLEERARGFVDKLAEHFVAVGLPASELDTLVPITFLSPLLPDEGDDDGRGTLERALGDAYTAERPLWSESTDLPRWPVFARRFARDGGWDQRRGGAVPELAVVGGAVYVARFARPWNDPGVLAALRELERAGVGRRRHQGFGHLICFDPFILTRGAKP